MEHSFPFNQNISASERKARMDQIYFPYHNRIHELLDERNNSPSALVAIHSFTPRLSNGDCRDWHIDLMSRTSMDFVHSLQNKIQTALPDLNVGISQVFQMHDKRDYTLPHHGESRDIPNASIEIRNDMLAAKEDIDGWGEITCCLPVGCTSQRHSSCGQSKHLCSVIDERPCIFTADSEHESIS